MINVLPVKEIMIRLRDRTSTEFTRAAELIEQIDDETFTDAVNSAGSIGTHFRHNFDFALAFLKGLQTGVINYAARERDERFEKDRRYAVERIEFLTGQLTGLSAEILETFVAVRSELDEKYCHLSNASREFEFLLSHTIHHHALIAERLRMLGIETSAEFGVAPSTLEFWKVRGEPVNV